MNERLVYNSVQIMSLLLKDRTNVNSVIKRTGLYKDYVHEALLELKKAGLISRTSPKKPSQIIFNALTPLGVHIANFNAAVEEFEISYTTLLRSVSENFDFEVQDKTETAPAVSENVTFGHSQSPSKLKSVLLGRGWDLDEISHYRNWSQESKEFVYTSLSTFIVALCAEYVYLLFYENVINNQLAGAILTKIFTSAIQLRLRHPEIRGKSRLVVIDTLQVILRTNNLKAAELSLIGTLEKPVRYYIEEYPLEKKNFLNNRFVGDQVKEVVNRISSIHTFLVGRNQ